MQPTHAAPKKKPARRDEGAVGLEVGLAFWEPLCPSPRGRHEECPDNWKKEKSCEREPERQIKICDVRGVPGNKRRRFLGRAG